MAGLFPSRHPASGRVSWPRGLQRAAFLLAASVALFWSSVAFGRWMIPIPDSGPIYGDLLIAWVAVLVHISTWPNLWAGLRDLRAREPNGASILVAWRAFLLTVVVIVAAVAILVFEYRAIVSPDAWMFILYVLESDREAHQAIRDSLLLPLFLRHARVGHRCRVLDQRLDAAKALGRHDHLEPFEPLDDPGWIANLEA